MSEAVKIPDFNSSIVEHARKDFPLLDAKMSVAEALDRIRREGVAERVIYFSWRVFRYRFPWLLATVAAGTGCALLAGAFAATLAGSLVITFFFTMVLGLNESVSMQSMTLTIQALRANTLTRPWFFHNLRREMATAILLGLACGAVVGAIVLIWRQDAKGAGVVGTSIAVSLVTACLFGFSVPSLLHSLKLDPKIAAGPVTLADTDFCALAFYFSLAWFVLG